MSTPRLTYDFAPDNLPLTPTQKAIMDSQVIPEGAVDAAEELCPIAYDHTGDLDGCAACGWSLAYEIPTPRQSREMSTLTGPGRIREAVARLNGAYAPQYRVTFDCGDKAAK